MYHIDDPAELTAEERMKEVACILAKGFLRMKRRGPAGVPEGAKEASPGEENPREMGPEKPREFTEK